MMMPPTAQGHGQTADRDGFWDVKSQRNRRSLLFSAAGAVIGLAIAGFGLFTAEGTTTRSVPPEDVAVVNQQPILMSDYIAQLQALYGVSLSQATAAQKRKVLDDMIREELYVQRGVELGIPNEDTDTRAALVLAVEAQGNADALMLQPAENELRAYYDAHRDHYANEGVMDYRNFIVPPGNAMAAVASLKGGMNIDQAIARHGLKDALPPDGEEFYFAAKIHMGDRLFEIARRMRGGEVVGPVNIDGVSHIVVMKRNNMPQPQEYEAVKADVLQDYRTDQAKQLESRNEQFLLKRADIMIAPGLS